MEIAWSFKRFLPGDKARESQVEKFFRSDVVADRATALVREGIQNSLDAGESSPVTVRIHLGGTSPRAAQPFTAALDPHLNALRAKLTLLPTPGDPIRYLVFEDFNTMGLRGDPHDWKPREDRKNAFFNFFRGEGLSEKSDTARGRHGVGKMVFATASRAHCLFGLTVRADRDPILMGASILRMHHIGSESYHPDGWFGEIRLMQGSEFVVPVRDGGLIDAFRDCFQVRRRDESGLSIVVPWLDPAVTHESLVSAVVEGYFWPILRGELVVEVSSAVGTVEFNPSTIARVAETLAPDVRARIRPTIALAAWAVACPPSESRIAADPPQSAPRWDGSRIPENVRRDLRQAIDGGERFALRVPMLIKPKKADYQPTHFDLYCERDPTLADTDLYFLREGLLISGARPRRTPGFRGLVVIDEGPLGTFLGDAENPAHTEWQKDNVREGYSNWVASIDFVVHSLHGILKILSEEEKEADPSLLLDLFSLPDPLPEKPGRGQRGRPKPPPDATRPAVFPAVNTKPKRFHLSRRDNGFVIRRGDPEAVPPAAIEVRAAYGVRRGSPFKRYRPADFQMDRGPITVEARGASIVEQSENRLRAEITADDFEIVVVGFDTNRDIHIDAKARDAEPVETADAPTP